MHMTRTWVKVREWVGGGGGHSLTNKLLEKLKQVNHSLYTTVCTYEFIIANSLYVHTKQLYTIINCNGVPCIWLGYGLRSGNGLGGCHSLTNKLCIHTANKYMHDFTNLWIFPHRKYCLRQQRSSSCRWPKSRSYANTTKKAQNLILC